MTQGIDIYTRHTTPPPYPITLDSLTPAHAVHRNASTYLRLPILARTAHS